MKGEGWSGGAEKGRCRASKAARRAGTREGATPWGTPLPWPPSLEDTGRPLGRVDSGCASFRTSFTVDEGIGFYASMSAGTCLAPVYRLLSPVTNKHLLTLSTSERDLLKSQGWEDEGIRFYAAAP